jgi:hypothetical protein
MIKYKFPSTRIFNMDESGISIAQDPGFILFPKEQNIWLINKLGARKKYNSNLHSECKR